MPGWLKHLVYLALLVVFAGCAGSCTGCDGCGLSPLPGGFDASRRVENSTSIRVTDEGFQFISQNLGTLAPPLLGSVGSVGGGSSSGGILSFEVPTTSQAGFNVCPDGPKPMASPPECMVETDLGRAALTITTADPHHINVTGTLMVRLQDLPTTGPLGLATTVKLGTGCNNPDFVPLGIDVSVSLEVDTDPTHTARFGYTKVVVERLDINQTDLENATSFCGGILGGLASALKGIIFPLIASQLTGPIDSAIEDQLCAKQDLGAGVTCPTGTFPDPGGTCRYCSPDANGVCPDAAADCVNMALGLDGNVDLSAALSSVSPGTQGGLDFLGALGGESPRNDGSGFAWGDLNAVNNGMSIGLLGGAEPRPVTNCVPLATADLPTGIPIPVELTENAISGWTGPGPHLGIAVSERYMNYAMIGAYNSGALCLGVASDLLGGLLNSQTLSLLIPSLKDLGRQQQTQQLALVVRPQSPPSLVVGNGTDIMTDPLLRVALNQFTIDFYVFASDRFIRAFTATFDLDVPVNLEVTEDGALAPVLAEIGVNNPTITNAPLIREDEQEAADALAGIIAGQVGSQVGSVVSPINLGDQLAGFGVTLDIPPAMPGEGSPGLRKLERGSDRFLGIFGTFALVTTNDIIPPPESDTTAELVSKRVDPAGLVITTLTDDNRPEVTIRASSQLDDGSRLVEFSHRVDGSFWRPWTLDREVTLAPPILSIQGRHRIEVRSRVAGEPKTVDRTPAVVEVVVDASAPEIDIEPPSDDDSLRVHVWDVVSAPEDVLVRITLDDGEPGPWIAADGLEPIDVSGADTITVEAQDEEGNLGKRTEAIIRGREDPDLKKGGLCNCRLPGGPTGDGSSTLAAAFVLLAIGLTLGRRRRARKRPAALSKARLRVLGGLSAMVIASTWAGCSCGGDDKGGGGKGGSGGFAPSDHCPGEAQCFRIDPGLVGSYASSAVGPDGSVWVAAYDDIGYSTSDDLGETAVLFGDLVVGKWDGTKVDWVAVDGLPPVDMSLEAGEPGGPPDPMFYDPIGFRHGLDSDEGDDVGLWTSIQVDADGTPHVAYYDATNRALKYAFLDGDEWMIHTVDQGEQSDMGRYVKLLLVAGVPTLFYMTLAPGEAGATQSSVRVATAATPAPTGAADWSFADAITDPNVPCRAFFCAEGESCRTDNFRCEVPISSCDPNCASGSKCYDVEGVPTCVEVLSKSFTDSYPDGIGLYLSVAVAPAGLGAVYYDRSHGNLIQLRQEAGGWVAAILDGQTNGMNGPEDTGDVGIGASLAIDSNGDWHVTYVNGFDEQLKYLHLPGGVVAGPPETVDDGSSPAGDLIVGDDSSVAVSASGSVFVAYQDATNGQLRWAEGVPRASGPGRDWSIRVIELPDHAGAFNQILELEGRTQVMTWWRRGIPRTEGDVVFVAP